LGSKLSDLLSTKQLVRTVLDGRILRFSFSVDHAIEGYLCGMDTYHWMIVSPDGHKHLIHKSKASLVTLGSISYSAEDNHVDLEKIVGPFRDWVKKTFNR